MSTTPPGSDDPTRADPGIAGLRYDSVAEELSRIGSYRLIRLLGRGGMGAVYLAEQLEPVQRQVALKLIRGASGEGVASTFFEVERQMLAQMQHPCIAQVYDAGTTETGQPWFAMEWVPGETLTDYCERHGLDTRARIRLFTRICQGVQHAHHRGIIHRDLKPANVLITEVDGEPLPKIIDFGVATSVVDDGSGRRSMTSDRAGTLAYMSPEQGADDRVELDTRTDVYSLGVMLFELLARCRPPEGRRTEVLEAFCDSLADTTQRQIRSNAADVSSMQEALDSARAIDWEVRCIVARALAPDREQRYESAASLARDLVRYLDGDVVRAVPAGRTYRWRKFIVRNRLPVAAGSLIALSLVIGLGVALWSLIQVQVERDHARAEAARAEQTSAFVTHMLGSIDPDYADGADTALLRRILDDAAERARAELSGQPRVLSEIEWTVGDAYFSIGEFDDARSHYERVIEISRDHPELLRLNARARRGVAKVEEQKGQFEDGLARIESLAEEVSDLYEVDDPLRLEIGATRASLLQDLNRFDEAEEQIREVLALSEEGRSTELRGIYFQALRSLAQIHSDQLLLDEADAIYRRLRSEIENWDDPAGRSLRLAALNDHAVAYLRDQQYAEAEPLLRQAVEGQERLYGEGHPQTIAAISNLAGSLRQQDQPDEALPYYRRALELMLETRGAEHPQVAVARYNLGNGYQDLGEYARAAELQRDALAMAEERMSDNAYVMGMLRLGLARSELGLGHAGRAEELLVEAIGLLSESAGDDHPRTEEAREYLERARNHPEAP